MMSRQNKDSIIAGVITLIALVIIFLGLWFGRLSFDGRELAAESTPEIGLIPDEEQFIEPELIKELGEENAINNDAPAPATQGNPEPDVKDNTKQVSPGKNPKPAPAV